MPRGRFSKYTEEERKKIQYQQIKEWIIRKYNTDPEYRERKKAYNKARYERIKAEKLKKNAEA